MNYVTVSSKIPKKLKELLNKYNIKPGPIIRKALEEEVKKRMLEELEVLSNEVSNELLKMTDEEIVELIREGREAR